MTEEELQDRVGLLILFIAAIYIVAKIWGKQ